MRKSLTLPYAPFRFHRFHPANGATHSGEDQVSTMWWMEEVVQFCLNLNLFKCLFYVCEICVYVSNRESEISLWEQTFCLSISLSIYFQSQKILRYDENLSLRSDTMLLDSLCPTQKKKVRCGTVLSNMRGNHLLATARLGSLKTPGAKWVKDASLPL